MSAGVRVEFRPWPALMTRETAIEYVDGESALRALEAEGLRPALHAQRTIRFAREEIDAYIGRAQLRRGGPTS